MLLEGFGFSGYRSIGDELVKIAPLKKINLIIGQNNSGKSNIITFLKEHLCPLSEKIKGTYRAKLNFSNLDTHISDSPAKTRVAYPLSMNSEKFKTYLTQKLSDNPIDRSNKELLKRLLSSNEFLDKNGYVWFVYEAMNLNGGYKQSVDIDSLKNIFTRDQWYSLWSRMAKKSGGDLNQHWIPETIKLLPLIPLTPSIEFIPAIRKIGNSGSKPDDFSGIGIIERLAELQNPPLENQNLKIKFSEINKFLKGVLENKSATIEIPYDREMILIHMDKKTLPLSSLGTGIHEVVILAAAATILDNSILCVEEPELHLHPFLQRKLIQYLSENTSNQYIFTTHSAHLLETIGSEVFHVRYSQGKTTVDAITTTKDRSNICHDLGYKASDILQSNCIIWVEGPSDRIYINCWLKSLDKHLVEGVHYSIMFYGGKLFSHLTANDDDEINEKLENFISVRNLNRNISIVFDSDKDKSRAHLNSTKKRLKEEFNKGPGFAWITKGREIENYIDSEIIENCRGYPLDASSYYILWFISY